VNPNNNQQLWESNFSSFDVPSNEVNNQAAESKPAENSVVGDHHKSRLDALRNNQETKRPESIEQPIADNTFTPPQEATTISEPQSEVEDLSFEGISLNSSKPAQEEVAEATPNNSTTIETKEPIKPVEQVVTSQETTDLVDPSNEFEEIETSKPSGIGGLTKIIGDFLTVNDGSDYVGKPSNKGGLDKVEQSLNSK